METNEAIQQQLQQLQDRILQLQQQQQQHEQQHQQQHQEILQHLRTPSPRPIPTTTQSTRDLRLRARTLHEIGWSYPQIARHLGLTPRQVQYALTTVNLTPQRRSGRPPLLTPTEVDELIEFICASSYNRRMSLARLPAALGWTCSRHAIRTALRRAGFKRYIARRKPPITEATRLKRLAFAEQYKSWTIDDWMKVLWSDETWATGGRHTRTWVTRRANEELEETCIVERHQRKKGWMFWGCFSGLTGKGPGLVWEKEWGTITSESYVDHIVPLIDGWLRLHPLQQHLFMQDNARPHTARDTLQEMQERGIDLINWPPFSPDLNPIESVWNKIKDFLEANYPENPSYDQLRAGLQAAWEAISEDWLQELLSQMPQRCQDVIDAEGRHTKW